MKFELNGRQKKDLIVEGSTVKIIRGGSFLAAKREKVLPFRNITSIEVKKPGAMWAGFIQFSIAGGQINNSSYKTTGGVIDAAKDENSIVFADQNSYEIALKIKDYFENYSETSNDTIKKVSVTDEIEKFKKLLDNGAITENDYKAKKKQLLGI